MTTVFMDTSAWVALLRREDKDHQRARQWFLSLRTDTKLRTTDHVIGETATWLRYHGFHASAIELRRMTLGACQTGLLEIEFVDEELMDEGWRIFEQYDDQAFSFCDCTSFAACRRAAVDVVFGFDGDFRTMGFDVRP